MKGLISDNTIRDTLGLKQAMAKALEPSRLEQAVSGVETGEASATIESKLWDQARLIAIRHFYQVLIVAEDAEVLRLWAKTRAYHEEGVGELSETLDDYPLTNYAGRTVSARFEEVKAFIVSLFNLGRSDIDKVKDEPPLACTAEEDPLLPIIAAVRDLHALVLRHDDMVKNGLDPNTKRAELVVARDNLLKNAKLSGVCCRPRADGLVDYWVENSRTRLPYDLTNYATSGN